MWGGEYIHVGLYAKLEGEDTKLKGVDKINRASCVNTAEVLSLFFPAGGHGPAPSKCVLMDMGAGLGGTARVAAKDYGCDVRRLLNNGGEARFGHFCLSLTEPFLKATCYKHRTKGAVGRSLSEPFLTVTHLRDPSPPSVPFSSCLKY